MRPSSFRRLLLSMGLAVLLSNCAPSLAGKITDQAGQIVTNPDARVNITSLEPNASSEMAVCDLDAKGRFESDRDLKPGSYLVEALVPGYALSSKTVIIGKDHDVTFVLKPLEKIKPTAIGTKGRGTQGGDDTSRGAGGATLTPPQL